MFLPFLPRQGQAQSGYNGYNNGNPNAQGAYNQPNNGYNQPIINGVPMTPEQADIKENKVMGVLSYLGLLCLIPIFAAKDSKFARFHANQGLVLNIFSAGYSVLIVILNAIMLNVIPVTMIALYGIISMVLSLGSFFFLVLEIMGIIHACQGTFKKLPLFGRITILK